MNIASLFNLAGPDLLIIFFIVLLLFGSKKLPELARGLGQAVKEFNKAKDEFERELTKPAEVAIQQPKDKQEFNPAAASAPAAPVAPTQPVQTAPSAPAPEQKPVS